MANNEQLSRKEFIDLLPSAIGLFSGLNLDILSDENTQLPSGEDRKIIQLLIAAGADPWTPVGIEFGFGVHHRHRKETNYPYVFSEEPVNSIFPPAKVFKTASEQLSTPTVNAAATPLLSKAAVPSAAGIFGENVSATPQVSQTAAKPSITPTVENYQLNVPQALLIGQGDDAALGGEVEEIKDKRGIKTILLGTFGTDKFGRNQNSVMLKVAAVEAVVSGAVLKPVVYKALSNIIERDITQLLDGEEGVGDKFFDLALKIQKEGVYWSGFMMTLLAINYMALNSNILGSQDNVPAWIYRAVSEIMVNIPEDLMKVTWERYYYLFSSLISLRNMNMALNLYHSGVMASYDKNLTVNADTKAYARFGLFHGDIKNEFMQGQPQLEQKFSNYIENLVSDYMQWITEEDNEDLKKELMTDFLLICQQASVPVSNKKIELYKTATLPSSGLAIMWKVLSRVSDKARLNRNTEYTDTLGQMIGGLAKMNYDVVENLWNTGKEDDVNLFNYSKTGEFSAAKEFELIIPSQMMEIRDSRTASVPNLYVVAIQNGIPYFLKSYYALGEWKCNYNHRVVLTVPQGSGPKNWKWELPISRYTVGYVK